MNIWIIVIAVMLISFTIQQVLESKFSKYSKVPNPSGLTGAQVAEKMLDWYGIHNVQVRRTNGVLTDHFDPRSKTVNLSDAVYSSSSIAAAAVAAHECGHVVQHAQGYGPLSFRTALFPFANIGSRLSWIFIIAGLIFGSTNVLVDIGILMFSLAVLFQLVTLPVEFNASSRALKLLESEGYLYGDENRQARKVLTAAAMTYVAAAATAILQLLRLIYLFGGRRRD